MGSKHSTHITTLNMPHPQQIATYDILAELGSGPMTVVYRAIDRNPKNNRIVALKVLRPNACDLDPHAQRRFLRECQSVAGCAHPHVAAVHQVGQDRDLCFMVREYVDGRTFEQYLAERGHNLQDGVRIIGEIASAVGTIHYHGLIHCNLQPSNVLIATDGTAKLIGFSCCRLINESQEFSPATPAEDLRGLRELMARMLAAVDEPIPEPISRLAGDSAIDNADEYFHRLRNIRESLWPPPPPTFFEKIWDWLTS